MFRNTAPDIEPAPDVIERGDPGRDHLIPLSHLALDLPEPVGGWDSYLKRCDLRIVLDDVGRKSISRTDARQLLDQQRENEARAREVVARQEREMVERDRAFRAQLPGGLPWFDIPVGATAPDVWRQAERDSQPKRQSVLQHALSNEGGMVFHPLPQDEADQS